MPRTVSIQRGVAELATKRRDVDVDGLRRAVPGGVPDLAQDALRGRPRRPASRASSASRSNSLPVSVHLARRPTVTRCARRSMRIEPATTSSAAPRRRAGCAA